MTFPNKGENHAEGVKNEKDVVSYLNRNQGNIYKKLNEKEKIYNFEHRGGTKVKEDAVGLNKKGEEILKLSIKRHKSENSGTFDWKNTTAHIQDDLIQKIQNFKYENNNNKVTPILRKRMNHMLSQELNNIDSSIIDEILTNIYKTYPEFMIINKTQSKNLVLIPKKDFSDIFNKKKNDIYVLKSSKNALTSRQIWIEKPDGTEINTNLRIRLVLNNGLGALISPNKDKKSNKTSNPCIKIQQDNVKSFINNCSNKIIEHY